jgi:hypothetical protein
MLGIQIRGAGRRSYKTAENQQNAEIFVSYVSFKLTTVSYFSKAFLQAE